MKRLLAVVLSLAACGGDHGSNLLGVDAPAQVRRFLEAESPGTIRGYTPVLDVSDAHLLVFRIAYGSAPCPTGCTLPQAYGLALGDRVGWLDGPAGATAFFDVAAWDTLLFNAGLWARLAEADATASGALRLRLASDRDTPLPALLAIATGLHEQPSGPVAIGSALLSNPTSAASFEVLIALGQINTWFGPGPWYDVVDTAWQRLAPLVPPLSRLKLNGFVQRTADGLIRPGASARNTGGSPTLLRYGPICAPIMQLFRDSSFNGRPLWDAERWWWTSHAGGCKLPPDIALLQPGDSVALGGGGFRVADVLGDSIPPGRYTAAILIRVATPPGDTTYLASAGTLDLSR